MAAKCALALLAFAPGSSASVVARGQTFLGNGMQPEVVAKTLSAVEEEWKAQAAVFAECDDTNALPGATIVNCADAPSSFGKSCSTVVNAIIQGSGGDKDVAKEYMADVCSQKSISGWHQQQCNTLDLAVRRGMSADKYANRQGFDASKLCTGFWSSFLGQEKQRLAKEKAEHEASEKQAEEETAAAEKEAVVKAEEQRKKDAETKKVEEAKRAKEEAEAKAAQAAARVAAKKAEAKATQEAAKQKVAEAEAAELEHQKAVAKQAAAAKAAEATVKAPAPKPVAAVVAPAAKKVEAPKAAAPKPAAAKLVAATKAAVQTKPVPAVAAAPVVKK